MGQELFGKLRTRREKGVSFFSGYYWTWSGASWHPLMASASNFQKMVQDGTASSLAEDYPASPGIYELAIAHRDQPRNHICVYLGAAESIRGALVELTTEGGDLRGFLDHCLKENHVVWVRYKLKSSVDAANAARDKALAALDFAWIQQQGARGRSLILKPDYRCCGCLCKSKRMNLKEGPPKFVTIKQVEQQKSGFMQMFSSKKR